MLHPYREVDEVAVRTLVEPRGDELGEALNGVARTFQPSHGFGQ